MENEKTKKGEVKRVILFTLFSISAGLIEIGAFTLLELPGKLPYWICYLVALILSVLWNFTLNRNFTFQSASNVPVAMLKVAVFYAVFTPIQKGQSKSDKPVLLKLYSPDIFQ